MTSPSDMLTEPHIAIPNLVRWCVRGPKTAEKQSQVLARNFVDDNPLRVLDAPIGRCIMSTQNTQQRHHKREQNLKGNNGVGAGCLPKGKTNISHSHPEPKGNHS